MQFLNIIVILSFFFLDIYVPANAFGDDAMGKSYAIVDVIESDCKELYRRYRRSIALSEEEKQAIVDEHNLYRFSEGATNSSMKPMRWSEDLANLAAEWADQCVWRHGYPTKSKYRIPYSKLGQNMAYSTIKNFGLPWVVKLSMTEKRYYNFFKNKCRRRRTCAHYTQVVWGATRDVGCAVTNCGPKVKWLPTRNKPVYFYICFYGPTGNTGGRPYAKPCPECTNGTLCRYGTCIKPEPSTTTTEPPIFATEPTTNTTEPPISATEPTTTTTEPTTTTTTEAATTITHYDPPFLN